MTRPSDRLQQQQQQRNCRTVDSTVPTEYGVKLEESEKKYKYLILAWELKKLWNMKVTVILFVIGTLGTVTQGLVKRIGGLRNKRTSGEHPNYSIVQIGQNTEKCSGDLRRLAVTQTLVKHHQLKLV